MVSKFLDYFKVDVKDELTKTIKDGSEIDCSTLLKMGFQKSKNSWINKNSEASSSDVIKSRIVVDESQANEMNALLFSICNRFKLSYLLNCLNFWFILGCFGASYLEHFLSSLSIIITVITTILYMLRAF